MKSTTRRGVPLPTGVAAVGAEAEVSGTVDGAPGFVAQLATRSAAEIRKGRFFGGKRLGKNMVNTLIMSGKQVVNLPNGLTAFRILVLPLLAILIMKDERFFSVVVLAVAGISDVLDGWYARKYRQESVFGKLMDPVADKILLCVAVLFLVAREPDRLGPTLGTLLLAREFLITGLRAMAAGSGIVLGADKMGKIKTFFQMVGLGSTIVGDTWIVQPGWDPVPGRLMGLTLLWIAVVLSYWSMVRYLVVVYRELKAKSD